MDQKIEELVIKANQNTHYQILLIFIGTMIFVTTNVISSTIGFFSTEPNVTYIVNGTLQSSILNYTICSEYPEYKIVNIDNNTWYASYGDECSQLVTWMIDFLSNFGALAGIILIPFMIKWFGQKNTVLIAGHAYTIVTFVNIFMPNFASALFFSFLNNMFASLMELAFFMLCAENCPGKLRTVGLNLLGSGYCFSAVIFIFLFDIFNSWRIPFIISAGANLLLTIAIHIFIYENPREYLKSGKVDLFVITLQKIAKFNKCEKSFDPIARAILREYEDEVVEVERSHISLDSANKSLLGKFKDYMEILKKEDNKYTIYHVLKYPSHRWIFLLMCYINFVGAGIYQAYSIALPGLPGNPYINGIIAYILQGVFCVTSGLFMNIKILKRKGLLILSIAITIILAMIVYFWKNIDTTANTVMNLALITTSYIFFQVTWTYNSEVYSTKLLNAAFTINTCFGRAGTMVFPYINQYLPTQMYIIFSAFLLSCIICFFFLPETFGKPLMTEIIEEREISNQERLI